ncbi:unnamed protein product [Cyprideis torosa]|uniref:Uncharacterized protein n=1 Tax=Cyprideis torosa TaxID=163714 RepID=A0A7R8ZJZ6_9CRUS|nr:unnamed protein product [Cyprideis torosa]CAG0880656.1 unnamed protein product [Cyprideis torosa]
MALSQLGENKHTVTNCSRILPSSLSSGNPSAAADWLWDLRTLVGGPSSAPVHAKGNDVDALPSQPKPPSTLERILPGSLYSVTELSGLGLECLSTMVEYFTQSAAVWTHGSWSMNRCSGEVWMNSMKGEEEGEALRYQILGSALLVEQIGTRWCGWERQDFLGEEKASEAYNCCPEEDSSRKVNWPFILACNGHLGPRRHELCVVWLPSAGRVMCFLPRGGGGFHSDGAKHLEGSAN